MSARFSLITQAILRDMQEASPPPLLPLLRSRSQAEILTFVLLGPEQEWTLTELASRTGASVSSAQREITRAEQAGVVSSRCLGNTRLVKAADLPLTSARSRRMLADAGRHLATAAAESTGDLSGAYQLAYDAPRERSALLNWLEQN
jgi:hypothetical protein